MAFFALVEFDTLTSKNMQKNAKNEKVHKKYKCKLVNLLVS